VIGLIHINFDMRTYWRSSILFGRFNLEACNVCKTLMKGSHNLSENVKMTKNMGRPSC
jgi:hypothetical protein